jgi:hypothetical protein
MQGEMNGLAVLPAGKRSYSPPVLVRYGAVSELTQAGSAGASENGSNPCPQSDFTKKLNASCMA